MGGAGYKVKDNSEAVTARKVVQLFQLPRILVLHLKRFSYTLNGTGKIHKPINYGERLRCGPLSIAMSLISIERSPVDSTQLCIEQEHIRILLYYGQDLDICNSITSASCLWQSHNLSLVPPLLRAEAC